MLKNSSESTDKKSKGYRNIENGKEKIIEDINVIYHLPKGYKHIHKCLDDPKSPVRKDLLDILNYLKKKDPIIYHQMYVYYLDTTSLTAKVRKKTTRGTSNRHFNFLCALGFFNKVPQTEKDMLYINLEMLIETGNRRPMNVITVPLYTDEVLDRIDQTAKLFIDSKVTPGNISNDKLKAVGLTDLAKRIFPINSKKSYLNKLDQKKKLEKVLESAMQTKGYIYMEQVAGEMNLSEKEVKKIWNTFKSDLEDRYRYGATTAVQAKKFNIPTKKWVISKEDSIYEENEKTDRDTEIPGKL